MLLFYTKSIICLYPRTLLIRTVTLLTFVVWLMITIDQEFRILEEFGFSIEAIIVQATTKVIYNHFWCCKSKKKKFNKSLVFRSYNKKICHEYQQKMCLISETIRSRLIHSIYAGNFRDMVLARNVTRLGTYF